MSTLYLLCFIAGVFLIIGYTVDYKWDIKIKNSYGLAVFIALAVRIVATKISNGLPNDIDAFKFWSNMVFTDGFKEFYSADVFTDYPPGYMIILYFLGFIKDFFRIDSEFGHTLLMKMPAIISDCFITFAIMFIGRKKMPEDNAFILGLFYALNPLSILISSVWGQIDSFFVIPMAISIYLLGKQKLMSSYSFYALAILTKPQAFMFAPLFLFSVYRFFKENNGFSKESFKKYIDNLYPAVLIIFIFCMPFTTNFNLMPILSQYAETLASYPHATVNAGNFYAIFSANWKSINDIFFIFPYSAFGNIAIVAITFLSIFMLYLDSSEENYFITAAFICFSVFMFSTRIHERYVFPAVVFFLIAYCINRRKELIFLYLGLSLTAFANTAMVLHSYVNDLDISLMSQPLIYMGIFNLALFGFMAFSIAKGLKTSGGAFIVNFAPKKNISAFRDFKLEKSENREKFSLLDKKAIIILTLITAAISFYKLGNIQSPQTLWKAETLKPIVVELEENSYIAKMQYFVGISADKEFFINISSDGTTWHEAGDVKTKGVFSWKEINISRDAKFIKITPLNTDLSLFEIGFRDDENRLIPIAESGAKLLTDEQNMVPEQPTYMNSTYFDEVYHARTAYEMLNGIRIYENTHPPLGKAFIAAGISLFGMTPFGWRFSGTLFGVLLIPLIYLFAKKLFKDSSFAVFSTLLMMFDFMRYTQTRIATIDTYVVFFIILMYYFMYEYYTLSFYDTPFKKTLKPLLLSGISMGLAIACKWPGVYAVAGIAIIFFYTMYRRFMEYKYAKFNNKDLSSTKNFPVYAVDTIFWCFLFFIGIPLLIYGASYITYFKAPEYNGLRDIIANQKSMFSYHSDLVSTHPYSSVWFEWPILKRPVFYYSSTVNGLKAGISSFGNPAIWWLGIAAFFYNIYLFIAKKNKIAMFLIIGYLSQYLPWVLISRTTYMYHYFPSIPFVIFMIAFSFKEHKRLNNEWVLKIYMASVIVLFIMFLPVLSGIPVSKDYVEVFLRWFPTWQLII